MARTCNSSAPERTRICSEVAGAVRACRYPYENDSDLYARAAERGEGGVGRDRQRPLRPADQSLDATDRVSAPRRQPTSVAGLVTPLPFILTPLFTCYAGGVTTHTRRTFLQTLPVA